MSARPQMTRAMAPVYVEAVGLAAPGLPDWQAALPVLRGEAPYAAAELAPYAPALLPPNERRRATPAVRQAFRAAEQCVAGRDPATLATVFAGSDADMGILHRICAAVAEPERRVSPTDFHNSVHNAAAGYWGIATGARAPSTTLAGHDGSFGLGLIEAAVQVATLQLPTLLVAFDVPAPEPLLAARPLGVAASCALLLTPQAAAGRCALQLCLTEAQPDRLPAPELEALRLANPALRALPLLRLLASAAAGAVVLPASGGRALRVDCTCA